MKGKTVRGDSLHALDGRMEAALAQARERAVRALRQGNGALYEHYLADVKALVKLRASKPRPSPTGEAERQARRDKPSTGEVA